MQTIKPSILVIYGQTDNRSTSFQTTQLTHALSHWLQCCPLRVRATYLKRFSGSIDRIISNYILPLFHQPQTDYVLYCNDGAADLRMWKAKKMIYWYDAYEDWAVSKPSKLHWLNWLRYQNILIADYVFCVSHRQVDMAREMRPGREDSVVYMPVGVNCKFFDPSVAQPDVVREKFNLPNKVIVGYLGYIGIRGDSFAGQPISEIAPELLKQQDVHFLIVGFGEGLSVFQKHVKQLGLENSFTFTGYVEDELVPHCVSAMDICIDTLEEGLHSEARSETKLKQYMAMGKACVATAIGENCVDLDNGKAGILVSSNSEDLLQGVLHLCNEPELRVQLGLAARKRAEEIYDWNRLAERMTLALGIENKAEPMVRL
jgi:glycosyltransferase involved in cell wall biosynthesis